MPIVGMTHRPKSCYEMMMGDDVHCTEACKIIGFSIGNGV